jgi:hypothetical protein
VLLTSFPNMRAAEVKALGRACGTDFVDLEGGAGEISIGFGYSLSSGVKGRVSRGGELMDTFDANESSKSEERNSSTSSRGRALLCRRTFTCAIGALRKREV